MGRLGAARRRGRSLLTLGALATRTAVPAVVLSGSPRSGQRHGRKAGAGTAHGGAGESGRRTGPAVHGRRGRRAAMPPRTRGPGSPGGAARGDGVALGVGEPRGTGRVRGPARNTTAWRVCGRGGAGDPSGQRVRGTDGLWSDLILTGRAGGRRQAGEPPGCHRGGARSPPSRRWTALSRPARYWARHSRRAVPSAPCRRFRRQHVRLSFRDRQGSLPPCRRAPASRRRPDPGPRVRRWAGARHRRSVTRPPLSSLCRCPAGAAAVPVPRVPCWSPVALPPSVAHRPDRSWPGPRQGGLACAGQSADHDEPVLIPPERHARVTRGSAGEWVRTGRRSGPSPPAGHRRACPGLDAARTPPVRHCGFGWLPGSPPGPASGVGDRAVGSSPGSSRVSAAPTINGSGVPTASWSLAG